MQQLQESELLPESISFVSILHRLIAVLAHLDNNSLNERCKFVAFPAGLADDDSIYLTNYLKQDDKESVRHNFVVGYSTGH